MSNTVKKNIFFIQVDTLSERDLSFFNIGMLSIATLLQNNGFEVSCLTYEQLCSLSYDQRQSFFKNANPDIIGFNVNSDNITNVKYLARDMKKWLPNCPILVGGPLISVTKESILNNLEFDFAIIGEGEYPTLNLCENIIRNKGNLREIPSIIYRNTEGEICSNAREPVIKNLDELPSPNYSLINNNDRLLYSSGRGCPFSCSFCFQGVHGKGYRYLSSERVVKDIIENCKKYNISLVTILDDTFVANPKRAIEISELLKKEKANHNLDFIFFCEGRIDTLYHHPELLQSLKEAGLVKLQLGIENGNQKILDAYNKKITLEQVESVVRNLNETDHIACHSNIIIGGPFETNKTFENSLNFAIKLMNLAPGLLEFVPSCLCPYPNTDIYNNPSKYGLKIIDTEWLKSSTLQLPSCETEKLNIRQVLKLKFHFINSIISEMNKITKTLDYNRINFQIALSKYGIETSYYKQITSISPVIKKYFDLKNDVSRLRLENINAQMLPYTKPIFLSKAYSSSNKYVIQGYFEPVYIELPVEKAIYDLSNGKLTMIEIAEYVKSKTNNTLDTDKFIESIMLPFYKRIEKSYQILFTI